MTIKELESLIVSRSIKDESFRKEFLANPKGTIEKYSGQALPGDLRVQAHANSPNTLHFVIPDVAAMQGELTDEDLEKVAGGEFFVTVAVVGAITAAVSGGAAIANDQTRARHGW
jgi:hypothetical protein